MVRDVTILCAALMTAPVAAQASLGDLVCDDTRRLETQLVEIVGATRQGQGMREPDALLEIWIVPRNGDWTIVQTYANGTSCIVAMGAHWESLGAEPG
ncbi:hypothetical protein [Dinoroseobacter sp. S76]|uniref:hypothetical protein n=1 Tax=Dinoroseobacter sp. S76 TaxID=3415124 RepID=UPI003C7D9927